VKIHYLDKDCCRLVSFEIPNPENYNVFGEVQKSGRVERFLVEFDGVVFTGPISMSGIRFDEYHGVDVCEGSVCSLKGAFKLDSDGRVQIEVG